MDDRVQISGDLFEKALAESLRDAIDNGEGASDSFNRRLRTQLRERGILLNRPVGVTQSQFAPIAAHVAGTWSPVVAPMMAAVGTSEQVSLNPADWKDSVDVGLSEPLSIVRRINGPMLVVTIDGPKDSDGLMYQAFLKTDNSPPSELPLEGWRVSSAFNVSLPDGVKTATDLKEWQFFLYLAISKEEGRRIELLPLDPAVKLTF